MMYIVMSLCGTGCGGLNEKYLSLRFKCLKTWFLVGPDVHGGLGDVAFLKYGLHVGHILRLDSLALLAVFLCFVLGNKDVSSQLPAPAIMSTHCQSSLP